MFWNSSFALMELSAWFSRHGSPLFGYGSCPLAFTCRYLDRVWGLLCDLPFQVPVRVHDACFTSEVLGSMKCDCSEQLQYGLNYIKENGPGIVCYLQQVRASTRGILLRLCFRLRKSNRIVQTCMTMLCGSVGSFETGCISESTH